MPARSEITAARRYARALLEVCFARPDGDPATLRRELEQSAAVLGGQPELAEALRHPGLPLEAKKRVVEQLWREASPLMRRLLEMLVERGRLGLLEPIAQLFAELWNAARGVVRAESLGAAPLTEEQRQAVERALGRLSGRDVELASAVDPALLGGLLVRLGGVVYDGTVRGRLRALRERLAAPPEG